MPERPLQSPVTIHGASVWLLVWSTDTSRPTYSPPPLGHGGPRRDMRDQLRGHCHLEHMALRPDRECPRWDSLPKASRSWRVGYRSTCPYSKLRKPKKSWSFSGIQSFE